MTLRWFPRHPRPLPMFALAAAITLLLGLAAMLQELRRGPTDAAALHVQQAEMLQVAGTSSEAPERSIAVAAPAGGWQAVALPYHWTAPVPAQVPAPLPDPVPAPIPSSPTQLDTIWLRATLAPPTQGTTQPAAAQYLFLPRWQAKGRIAVYADERLVYHSRGDLAWSAFNHPLWIALDADGGTPAPRLLRIRIDSLPGTSGAISSLWVGPAAALAPAFQLRRLLQIGLPQAMGIAMLGLGAFALVVWMFRRQETVYLLFAVFSVLWALRSLRFFVGLAPLDIPAVWFQWMNINAANALLVTWYAFMCTLVPTAPRWPMRLLLVLALVGAIATLPLVSGVPAIAALARVHILVALLGGVPVTLLMAWAAWRHRGPEGIAAAGVGLLHLPILVHDFLLESFRISPENLYLLPISTGARLLVFTYIVLNRYAGAVEQAERAQQRLADQLAAREAALSATYAQLRAVEREQTLGDERHRLMQDIHDGMGAQLMGALQLADQGALSEQKMAAILRESMDDLRLTVDSLEPVEADLLLLLATLRFRLAPRLESAGLRLRWDVQDVPALPWLDPRSALAILRILQEGLANAARNAQATELRVSTGEEHGGVFVALHDDGMAFTPALQAAAGTSLANMARRARALGGTVRWEARGAGTCFTLWLPLQAPQAA